MLIQLGYLAANLGQSLILGLQILPALIVGDVPFNEAAEQIHPVDDFYDRSLVDAFLACRRDSHLKRLRRRGFQSQPRNKLISHSPDPRRQVREIGVDGNRMHVFTSTERDLVPRFLARTSNGYRVRHLGGDQMMVV